MAAARHLILGLTGNLSSGKSTVARMLRDLGARTIDSDATVRCLLESDGELQAEIRAAFGGGVFDGDRIDRAALARVVFSDAEALARLERLTHPKVGRATERLLAKPTLAPATFIEAIKVVEGPNGERLDGLWVLEAPKEMLVARAVQGRHMAETDARQRLAAQSSVADKVRRFAQRCPGRPVWPIPNTGTHEQLGARVRAAWDEVHTAGGVDA